jgi:hypothetical protein
MTYNYYRKRKRGVKTGYRAFWGYRGVWSERKVGPGKWKFTFTATKGRASKGYGSVKRGSKINWKFRDVKQSVKKTNKGEYQTVLTGYKYFSGGKFR